MNITTAQDASEPPDRHQQPGKPVYCARCSYDLTGVESDTCPECGSSPLVRLPRPFPHWARRLSLCVGLLGWTIFATSALAMLINLNQKQPGGAAALMLLTCPGIPLLVLAVTTVPWFITARRFRSRPTLGDSIFVALLPWAAAAFSCLFLFIG